MGKSPSTPRSPRKSGGHFVCACGQRVGVRGKSAHFNICSKHRSANGGGISGTLSGVYFVQDGTATATSHEAGCGASGEALKTQEAECEALQTEDPGPSPQDHTVDRSARLPPSYTLGSVGQWNSMQPLNAELSNYSSTQLSPTNSFPTRNQDHEQVEETGYFHANAAQASQTPLERYEGHPRFYIPNFSPDAYEYTLGQRARQREIAVPINPADVSANGAIPYHQATSPICPDAPLYPNLRGIASSSSVNQSPTYNHLSQYGSWELPTNHGHHGHYDNSTNHLSQFSNASSASTSDDAENSSHYFHWEGSQYGFRR